MDRAYFDHRNADKPPNDEALQDGVDKVSQLPSKEPQGHRTTAESGTSEVPIARSKRAALPTTADDDREKKMSKKTDAPTSGDVPPAQRRLAAAPKVAKVQHTSTMQPIMAQHGYPLRPYGRFKPGPGVTIDDNGSVDTQRKNETNGSQAGYMLTTRTAGPAARSGGSPASKENGAARMEQEIPRLDHTLRDLLDAPNEDTRAWRRDVDRGEPDLAGMSLFPGLDDEESNGKDAGMPDVNERSTGRVLTMPSIVGGSESGN